MGQWKKVYPNSENEIKQIPNILQQNFSAIEDAYNIEHYSPASGSVGLSGEHRIGSVGAIYEGTTTQIAALTSPMSGALAFDTTLGVLVKYSGSNWLRLSQNYWSRFKAACTNTVIVTAGASANTLVFDTEDYDTLNEYDHTSGIFTALASGYYLLIGQLTMVASGTQLTSSVTSATGIPPGQGSQYPPAHNDTYVKATTKYATDSWPYFATDPAKSLTGTYENNSWMSQSGVVTNQRFHIDLGSEKIIKRIYYENFHHVGTQTDRGVENFTFWGSTASGDFADLVYANDGTWVQLTTAQSTFDQHAVADASDPKYIEVTNTTSYRYYAFKFADNWGNATYMGVRRIELQTGAPIVTWTVSGAASNLLAIDDYPTANDADFNTTQTCGATDIFSGGLGTLYTEVSPFVVTVNFRSRRRGCICNNTCYGENCTCNNACYGYSCSCNNACYGDSSCSCNNTCYVYIKGSCTCYNVCYGYAACSCNATCYVYDCVTCYNTTYGSAGCTCDTTCYLEAETIPATVLRKGDINYLGTSTMLTSSFVDYNERWTLDPSTGLAWTAASVSGIQGFGYSATLASAGCSADISQCYLSLQWFPSRPVMGLHVYKNNILYQSTYRPIHEAVTSPYQTVNTFSILFLVPGDTIKIAYTKTLENDYIFGNTAFTYFAMHRLPVDLF